MADPATWAPEGEGRGYDLARAAYWAMVRDPQRSLLRTESALLTSRRHGGTVTAAAYEQIRDYALTFRLRVDARGVAELVADEGRWPVGLCRTVEAARTQALALLNSLLIVPGVPRHFARRAA